jgi:N-acetylneuraminic acid mutarotase
VRIGWRLYVIGGWDPGHKRDGGDILSDVWALDLKTAAWQQLQLSPQGEQLQPISRFQAVAVGDDIYIHTHRNTDSILRLRTSTADETPQLVSLPVNTPNGAPASRGLHSLTAVGSKLYLFGGAPKSGPMLDDLWVLDLGGDLTWQRLSPGGRPPHARCSHAAAAAGGDIVYSGGSYYKEGGGLQPLADTFVLDTAANEWRWPDEQDGGAKPAARNAATMNKVGEQLVLHGGWNPFVETYNDTWVLPL